MLLAIVLYNPNITAIYPLYNPNITPNPCHLPWALRWGDSAPEAALALRGRLLEASKNGTNLLYSNFRILFHNPYITPTYYIGSVDSIIVGIITVIIGSPASVVGWVPLGIYWGLYRGII